MKEYTGEAKRHERQKSCNIFNWSSRRRGKRKLGRGKVEQIMTQASRTEERHESKDLRRPTNPVQDKLEGIHN